MSNLDAPRSLSRNVWILAAVGAVAIHAGGMALALTAMQPDDSDEDLGAPAIEIGIELTTPRITPTGVPVGPDTVASIASPAMVEQEQVVEQTDLPKAKPTETDDPDRVVALDNTPKPKDDDPKPPSPQSNASKESVAAEATAMPALDNAVQAPRSAAPAPGTGESARRERVTWQQELFAHFNKHKSYPADRSMQRAEVVVSFTLDRTGHILSANIVKGSGDRSFDDAALAMLHRADPVPTPPAPVADEGLTFSLPVVFQVKGLK
jgi:TonB family protein